MNIRIVMITTLSIVIALAGCRCSDSSNKNEQSNFNLISRGIKMPDFELTTVDGEVVKLSDYSGKIVLINVWATWCGPCKIEIPSFIRLMKKYADSGFVIIGTSADARLSRQQLKQFADKMGINYPIGLIIESNSARAVFSDVRSIPTTYIIDAKGNIRDKVIGATSESYFESRIKKLLSERPKV